MLLSIGSKPRTDGDAVALLLACHEKVRHFVALARRLAADPALDDALVADGCRAVERYFTEALPLHVRDEEDSVTPRLRGRSERIDGALVAMARQHEGHDEPLRALLEALRALREGPRDASTHARLANAVDAAGAELEAHLRLEEGELFPALRALGPEVSAALVAEFRARREP